MKQRNKYITGVIVIVSAYSFYALSTDLFALNPAAFASEVPQDRVPSSATQDTASLIFPVSPIIPPDYNQLKKNYPIDLRNPDDFGDNFEYNPKTNRYELRSKVGDSDVTTPLSLTTEEYLNYTLSKSMGSYFKSRNDEEFSEQGEERKDALSMFDFNFDLGPAEKIFGPGGVRLQAQGSINTQIGLTHTSSGDPTQSEKQRNRFAFNFDPQIQANIAASVGDKVNFDLNYNTESTFDFDSKKLKLAYAGKEDEIVKVLEAGNVSMNTTNSLIRGGTSLFGIKTELQFGKLTVGAIFSQQESQSRTTASKGSVQTTPFEIKADNYDENMHFFLDHYFYENYDEALKTLPAIRSGIVIDEIEVWITNKRSNYDQARNIIAFADLGETTKISNPGITVTSPPGSVPANRANSLYETLISPTFQGIRDISRVNQLFQQHPIGAGKYLENGRDYEKIENARKLDRSEYRLNSALGYISLRSQLQSDEVLAVAYKFSYGGKTYTVGELSTDNPDKAGQTLFLKLLKGISMIPSSPTWRLMMKNVYTISNRSIEQDRFRLDVKYQNDTTGAYMNYLTEGNIANRLLLRVMNLDRLNSRQEAYSDGFFDYVEGQTVVSQQGKIIFPVIEPFGQHLADSIGDAAIAEKYIYTELYDSTLTVARQIAEKNKFILTGEYKGSGSSNIEMDGYNIARGSVVVTANNVRLKENQDYTVNYATGEIDIINPAYENADIQTSYENQDGFGMQRKTMTGLNLNYAFSKDFNLGATVMNLREMPMTMKVNPGEESINNTLFGFNTNYSTKSQWLTNMVDKLPFVELTAPSQITFNAEYAQLIPDHYKNEWGGNYSYIDDFERAKMPMDLKSPYAWKLASTPASLPDAKYVNDIRYGNNRALLAWYYIDRLFTRKSSLTPTHIKNDDEQLSNHYVREVRDQELFPNKDTRYNESSAIQVLNLAFYPKERGPYNLDAEGMNPDGTLQNPEDRWGGIFRKIDNGQTDFEANNIEYIEFWVLDPFIYNKNNKGELYFNLGEVSEDILKDEKKFFENGLPINGDTSKVEKTVWGYVPKMQSINYAFENDAKSRRLQDVGLNGLSTEQEFQFDTYRDYLSKLDNILSPETKAKMPNDPFSPLRDPAGDNYHYYRGSDYDRMEASILERYKRYNATEGNSVHSDDSPESYATAAQVAPDVEDINQDNTLNESEQYFEYKVTLDPNQMEIGQNYIVDKRVTSPKLKNGKTEEVTWYQFKIPVQQNTTDRKEVGRPNMQSIRFVRMYLKGFSETTILRFATLELVKGDWRTYTHDLYNTSLPPQGSGTISIATVNLEENGNKEPVNYIMPPGVTRQTDPGQPQLVMQNEQALSAKIQNLSPGDARAIYKNTGLDTRQYKRLQMFVHAEKLPDMEDSRPLENNELSVFLRLGSDYKNNYYEYEIPLKLTPSGKYSDRSSADREKVWPHDNMFDFPFELLTNLKLSRNKKKREGDTGVNFHTPYSEFDSNKPLNKITVLGNPSLSDIKVVMIGFRNNANSDKSAEIWVNELRLTEFNEDGGWAANANLYVALSDLGTLNLSGHKETAGFGSLDQGIMDRNLDDRQAINVATQIDLGKFFPEKAKVSLPVYYSYREESVSPKYNPLDQDILLKDALAAATTKAEKDSINNFAVDKTTSRSLDINNVRINITGKNPMPYDPANFTFGYSTTEQNIRNATTEYERQITQRFLFSYLYAPLFKPWRPFYKDNKPITKSKLLSNLQFGYLPKNISFNSDINRNYYEIKLRDLGSSGVNMIPASFREDFYWERSLALNWDLTKNLRFNLNTLTNARIDAPHVQVNKKINMDEYTLWKDSVMTSIRDMGTPMEYNQVFTATYQLPFRDIPLLSFISNGAVSYNARYDWLRGAVIPDVDYEIGNTITNERSISLNNMTFNLVSLYNKNEFLEKVNKKYVLNKKTTPAESRNRKNNQQTNNAAAERRKRKFEGEVTLNTDSTTVVRHSLNNKRVRVLARNANGKLYKVNFKAIDNNSIRINNKDSAHLSLSITQLPPLDDLRWYKIAQGAARGLMMVRSVNVSYSQTQGLMLPYFRPEIGNFIGQGSSMYGKAPGFDFAFGFVDESYIDRAWQNNWLIRDDQNVNPAMYNITEMFDFSALIEPFTGMKITLRANRTTTDQTSIYFTEDARSKRFSGNFSMTTIALKSAFGKSNAENGYYSKAFEQFLRNRTVIAQRLENNYQNTQYPSGGFFEDLNIPAGTVYDPEKYGGINENSSDVLIPAFLAAYTGKNATKMSLNPFPALKNLLPNWEITYDGFIQLDFIAKYFKTFTFRHRYNSNYNIGAYNSFSDWEESADGMGFIQNVTTGNPTPSSPFNVTAVSIRESFDPFIGLSSVFHNNVDFKLEYKTSRQVNLNVSSYQIVETSTEDFGADFGYRFENFNRVLKLKKTGGDNFNNELRVSAGVTYRKAQSLIRKIQDNYTQAQSGDSQTMLKLTADYTMSRLVTMQAFFDRQMNKPLVSSTAYPFTKTAFGIVIKVSLNQ
ncbi:MAG: cell surface protein SprA [Dysgonamonadaceae bacterium]|jgi:cell surface protein SprA|nr:cell surface protein SprA [Dysgonamonadaceae bacterium]